MSLLCIAGKRVFIIYVFVVKDKIEDEIMQKAAEYIMKDHDMKQENMTL